MQSHWKLIILISVIIGLVLIVFIIVSVVISSKKPQGDKDAKQKRKERKVPKIVLPGEVFYYNEGDDYAYGSVEEAESACRSLGVQLATMEQLEKSYKRGAEWCGYGWTREGIRAYPMRDHSEACEGRIGIVQGELPKAGAVCFGHKPKLNTPGVLPFRPGIWNMADF